MYALGSGWGLLASAGSHCRAGGSGPLAGSANSPTRTALKSSTRPRQRSCRGATQKAVGIAVVKADSLQPCSATKGSNTDPGQTRAAAHQDPLPALKTGLTCHCRHIPARQQIPERFPTPPRWGIATGRQGSNVCTRSGITAYSTSEFLPLLCVSRAAWQPLEEFAQITAALLKLGLDLGQSGLLSIKLDLESVGSA